MNVETLGNLGDFIGGVAVILTLIYLALQVRQNTRQVDENSNWLRAQTYRADQDAHLLATQLVVSDASLAEIYRKGVRDPDSLTDDEWTRFSFYIGLMLGNYQASLYQVERGLLDEDLWPAQVNTVKRLMNSPGGRRYWQKYRTAHTPKFQEFLEENAYGE